MQTERITFLTTPDHKAALASRAAARGISIGEYVRRRTDEDEEEDLTPEQEAELALLIAQVNEAIPKMIETVDKMIENLRSTHEYIRNTVPPLDHAA